VKGFTLVEMVAALAILALMTGVTVMAWQRVPATRVAAVIQALDSARTEAIESGRSGVWHSGRATVRFRPDGSSSGGSVPVGTDTITVDELTGVTRVR